MEFSKTVVDFYSYAFTVCLPIIGTISSNFAIFLCGKNCYVTMLTSLSSTRLQRAFSFETPPRASKHSLKRQCAR